MSAFDFETPLHLADHLAFLSGNETAYMRYMSWRGGAAGTGLSDSAPYSKYFRKQAHDMEFVAPLFVAGHTNLDHAMRRAQVCNLCNRTPDASQHTYSHPRQRRLQADAADSDDRQRAGDESKCCY